MWNVTGHSSAPNWFFLSMDHNAVAVSENTVLTLSTLRISLEAIDYVHKSAVHFISVEHFILIMDM